MTPRRAEGATRADRVLAALRILIVICMALLGIEPYVRPTWRSQRQFPRATVVLQPRTEADAKRPTRSRRGIVATSIRTATLRRHTAAYTLHATADSHSREHQASQLSACSNDLVPKQPARKTGTREDLPENFTASRLPATRRSISSQDLPDANTVHSVAALRCISAGRRCAARKCPRAAPTSATPSTGSRPSS